MRIQREDWHAFSLFKLSELNEDRICPARAFVQYTLNYDGHELWYFSFRREVDSLLLSTRD